MVTVEGLLGVCDLRALLAHLENGIGHAKAFGCGCRLRLAARASHRLTSVLAARQTETDMHTLTADELKRQPQQLIDNAQRGETAIVTVAGEPVMMTVPLGKGIDSRAMLVDLAATLFDREQISLGLAARFAGLSYSEMIDELGRREIAVIRLEPGELERELAAFRD